MRKTLLLKLADLLEQDARNATGIKFDLGSWGYVSDEENPISCGTAGCAMGLAVVCNTFVENGLKPHIPGYSLQPRWEANAQLGPFETIMELFGISYRATAWLFSNYVPKHKRTYVKSYRGSTIGAEGEMKVARRIRAYVAGRSKPPVSKKRKG